MYELSHVKLILLTLLAGDQGFLNSYFPNFANAHLFDPDASPESRPAASMERLSTLYNADVGLYMLANKVKYTITLLILKCLSSDICFEWNG